MSAPTQTPSEEELKKAGNLNVLDGQGNQVQFSSIYSNQKTIVVFIRKSFSVIAKNGSWCTPQVTFSVVCVLHTMNTTTLTDNKHYVAMSGPKIPADPADYWLRYNKQEYVTALADVSQQQLQASNVKIVVIGCGDWPAIKGTNYAGEQ